MIIMMIKLKQLIKMITIRYKKMIFKSTWPTYLHLLLSYKLLQKISTMMDYHKFISRKNLKRL